jgi:hypothetical protein
MANEGSKKTNEEENSVESPSSVANYYLCPSYVLPDPECLFDYSKFTIPIADEPIYHRLGHDGQECHFQNQIKSSTETGKLALHPVRLTEGELQEYLRNQKYCAQEIMMQGSCQGHPGDFCKGVSLWPFTLLYRCLKRHLKRSSKEVSTETMIEIHMLQAGPVHPQLLRSTPSRQQPDSLAGLERVRGTPNLEVLQEPSQMHRFGL